MTAIISETTTSDRMGRSSVRMWPGILAGLLIGTIAFILSFDALRLVFVACGINPMLSWGGPVCVDGTILLCTWATWGFKKGHIRGGWYPWAGLVLFSGFSIAGNALHALVSTGWRLPEWVPPTIMSIPPLALLYATHLIVIVAGNKQDKLNRLLDTPETNTVAATDGGTHAAPAPAVPAPAAQVDPAPMPDREADPRPADVGEEPITDFRPLMRADANTGSERGGVDADPKANEAKASADADQPAPSVSHPALTVIQPQPDPQPEQEPEPEPEPAVEPEPRPEPETEPAGGSGRVDAPKAKAAVELGEWLAWADHMHETGQQISATRAVEDGLASSISTAKRRLREYRDGYPERFQS